MAKKTLYYYDEESCTYQPEQNTPKQVAKKVLSFVGGATLLSCFFLAVFFFAYDNPKEAFLKKQNADLIREVASLEKQFASLEEKIDVLHNQDNAFYRSLLNTDQIDEGFWNGGKGGAVQAVGQGSKPEVLRDAEQRLDRLQNKMNIQNQSYSFLFDLLSKKEEELKHIPAIKPVPGKVISGFGMRMHPIQKIRKMHTGLDLQANTGTEVYATGDGVVRLAGRNRGGYGIQVEIDHGGYGYITKYAHLSEIKVKVGQRIKRGDIIGLSGNTGLSKGPHLHYEIIKNDRKIDPIDYFYGDLTPEEYVRLREEAKVENMSMD
ncbi:MAG: M23 family metallopeptidase [Bacteroidetes bacterium]|nr:MAG: M23 family metallopeptidase [Bacteroidota bacterium]